MNKSLETAYNMAIRRKYPIHVPYGEVYVTGIAFAIICYQYHDCPKAIKEGYKKVLDLLIGNL